MAFWIKLLETNILPLVSSDLDVRTPIPSHVDLAGNTSYHFAASRPVFPTGVALPWPGTVCAFWLTYMIVSLASI